VVKELIELVKTHNNNKVKAYYKMKDTNKVYYDYQLKTDETVLNGLYDVLSIHE
jgi:hypothetical protein